MENPIFQYNDKETRLDKFFIYGVIIVAILTPIIVIGIITKSLYDFDSPHPSDNELIQNFQNNEADFEKLNQMAKEDSDFVRIAHHFNWTKESADYPPSKLKKVLPEERWNEYRNLFDKLNLTAGICNYQPKEVWFLASGKGMVTGGSTKGYMYLAEEPSPIIESLDKPNFNRPEFEGKSSAILYRKLKGNWYLYYEID